MSTITTLTLGRHAEVRAVLADPRFTVPPLPAERVADTGIGWLRAHVSRFATGGVHERRRGLATAELARIDPDRLRDRARELSGAPDGAEPDWPATGPGRGAAPDGAEPDWSVAVLAEALGVAAPLSVARLVAAAARGYFPGTDGGPAADAAVAGLVEAFGGTPDEATAARIGLLVQACDATAGLIRNALELLPQLPAAAPAAAPVPVPVPVRGILVETLRYAPPVPVLRRVAAVPARVGHSEVTAGTLILLDLVAANRDPAVFAEPDRFDPWRPERERHLTFGAGLRPCPAGDHALALAAGVIEAVRTR